LAFADPETLRPHPDPLPEGEGTCCRPLLTSISIHIQKLR
jgi:hypothetical protein